MSLCFKYASCKQHVTGFFWQSLTFTGDFNTFILIITIDRVGFISTIFVCSVITLFLYFFLLYPLFFFLIISFSFSFACTVMKIIYYLSNVLGNGLDCLRKQGLENFKVLSPSVSDTCYFLYWFFNSTNFRVIFYCFIQNIWIDLHINIILSSFTSDTFLLETSF